MHTGSDFKTFITRRYVIGLVLIAATVTGLHISAHGIKQFEQYSATVINISGRQRMLTQHMAMLASRLVSEIDAASRASIRSRLAEARARYLDNHNALLYGSDELGLEPIGSEAVRAMFLGPVYMLDPRVRGFAQRVDLITSESATRAQIREIADALVEDATASLAADLDKVAATLEREALSRVEALRRYEMAALVVSLLVLLAEAVFVFAPMARTVGRRTEELAEALHDASTDPLTGLPNRRGFARRVADLMAAAPDGPPRAFVAAIDLDRFKPLNDLYGHAFGDAALVEIGGRLAAAVGPGGVAARLGGDEFLLFLPCPAEAAEGGRLLRDLTASLNRSIVRDGIVAHVGASVGAVYCPRDGADIDTLIRRADLALYENKRGRSGGYSLFEPHMEDAARLRGERGDELRAALRDDEIIPCFRAVADLKTHAVLAYEIAPRWLHRTRGPVAAEEFMPAAEAAGLVAEIMSTVLRKACTIMKSAPQRTALSIAIAPVLFEDDWLAERILKILVETGFPPHRLEIGIAEEALVRHAGRAHGAIASLKRQGVAIVLDEVGGGHGALRSLRDLPIDRLKIDPGVVRTIGDSTESRSVVDAIIGLARELGIRVTADGIEDADRERQLAALGCDAGQGDFYGEPGTEPVAPFEWGVAHAAS